eukprot:11364797-Alexandrium_andersonii.AAC.1
MEVGQASPRKQQVKTEWAPTSSAPTALAYTSTTSEPAGVLGEATADPDAGDAPTGLKGLAPSAPI